MFNINDIDYGKDRDFHIKLLIKTIKEVDLSEEAYYAHWRRTGDDFCYRKAFAKMLERELLLEQIRKYALEGNLLAKYFVKDNTTSYARSSTFD